MRLLAHVIRRRTTTEPDAAGAAETVLRVAVLLQAGIAPARAWEHLAATGDTTAAAVQARVRDGMPLPRAIAAGGEPWPDVAVAWTVAATVGAPLADSLRAIAAALRDGQEAADEVRVALAEPAGTARLMGWLPLVAVVLGVALGFDTLGVLGTNPLGIACLIGGLGLIVGARRWTGRLVRAARPPERMPGLDAELIAIGLSGGASIDRARRIVAEAAVLPDADRGAKPQPGENPDSADGPLAAQETAPARRPRGASDPVVDPRADIDATLELSRTAGVPAVELLRASAALSRHRARTAGRLRAAALSTRLLLPLGVCTLPAFLLLGVAPMLLSVLASTTLTL
ncbi:type II secretion system F family protein [Microbacterium sp. CJ88]|uniref:type II secretion system F family protein n=1 Tax=Microbacterium sp. CJ88 TaxID=3445672 RepID=UPI003F65D525